QQVEHNTFNVGVLGSSPRRITETTRKIKQIPDNQILSGISFFWQIAKIAVSSILSVDKSWD
ncbi:hypothetical protein, partial [Bacteroides nordii]|uniref:hypothetical protein n=1 Tax=Bacteroides nordii TaxID=291645 RepID=UPI001E347FD1